MFYYPNVLNRRSGCFSTIWLAATKGKAMTRRDFLKVNVQRTCVDIMDYVLVRVPPPQPGLPRPRFSLYLSSQLQYGVIIVYHRQCLLLLNEIQHILERLAKARVSQRIDMEDLDRQAQSLPEMLSALEENEWAQDPLFGQMHSENVMPSPSTLMQLGLELRRQASPEGPPLMSPRTPLQAGITAAKDSITLIDKEPLTIPSAEFDGLDLAEVTPGDMGLIDMLMEQSDHFPEGEIETERERGPEREQEREFTGSTIELQPTTLQSDDLMVLLDEEAGPDLPIEMPAAAPAEERTPVSVTLPQSPPSQRQEGEVDEERRRRSPTPTLPSTSPILPSLPLSSLASQVVSPPVRRRQLLFIDQKTQISQDAMQQQIDNIHIETKPLVLISRPSQGTVSPADLFNTPCITLPPELLLLWKQAAVITPLTGSALQAGVRDTDTDTEREERAKEEAEEGDIEKRLDKEELSPKEVPRGLGLSDVSAPSLLSLEASDKESSPLAIPESKGSPVPRSVSTLMDIPEEGEELLEREVEDMPVVDLPEELLGRLEESLVDMEVVHFHSLLTPLADRKSVTHSFWALLEMVSARRLCVQQDEPYGDISISPGPNYEEGNTSV